jgi:serine/threonine protein phosphatase 1
MARYAIGDIHGRIDALKQVLKDSEFNYDKDRLIVLGDIVDGGPDAKDVIDELMKINDLIYIIGNHDHWFLNHLTSGQTPELWTQQGGAATLESYGAVKGKPAVIDGESNIDLTELFVPIMHQEFFNKGVKYHVEDNMVFVHGGFRPDIPLKDNSLSYCMWDRQLIAFAENHIIPKWDKVFVGHSTTICQGTTDPIKHNNLWMLDTGAGHCGKLTIMDVDTEEYWQSDIQPSVR